MGQRREFRVLPSGIPRDQRTKAGDLQSIGIRYEPRWPRKHWPPEQRERTRGTDNISNPGHLWTVVRHPVLPGSRPHGTWSPLPTQTPRDERDGMETGLHPVYCFVVNRPSTNHRGGSWRRWVTLSAKELSLRKTRATDPFGASARTHVPQCSAFPAVGFVCLL